MDSSRDSDRGRSAPFDNSDAYDSPSFPPSTPYTPPDEVVVGAVVVVEGFSVYKTCSLICKWSSLDHQHQQPQPPPQQQPHHPHPHPRATAPARNACDHCAECDSCWEAATEPLVPADFCSPDEYPHSILEHSTPFGIASHLAARFGHGTADRLVEQSGFETVRTVLSHLELLNGLDLDVKSIRSPAGLLTWYAQRATEAQLHSWATEVRQRELELAAGGERLLRFPRRPFGGQQHPPDQNPGPPLQPGDLPEPRPPRRPRDEPRQPRRF